MNHKRGMAIEYVMLTMLLVVVLITALLISASYSSQKAKMQRNYIERKAFLDESAQTFIEQASGLPFDADALQASLNTSPDNKYGYVFVVEQGEAATIKSLTAKKRDGATVVLYVELDSSGTLVAYRYSS